MKNKQLLMLFGCILFVLVLVVLPFLLTSASAPLAAPAPKALPKAITLGTNPIGSLYYAMGAGFAKVVGGNTPMKVEVLPQSATVWYPMLRTGEVNFGLAASSDASVAYAGKAIYKKATKGKGYRNLRIIMHGTPMKMSMVVFADSGIKTGKDLNGKRVNLEFGAHFSVRLNQLAMLANFGLTPADVKPTAASSYVDGVRGVIEGRTDASEGSMGSAVIKELAATPHGAYFIPLDPSPEAVERMRHIEKYDLYVPEFYVTMVKAGPAGVDEDKYLFAYPISLVCGESLSEEVVYTIVKAVWNNYKDLAPIHPRLKDWTPDRYVMVNTSIPYHPGAIRWYKEAGVWTSEMEKHQQELLTGR